MKKFLEDLKKELELKKMSKKEIEDIISDHKEMIDQAIEDGISEEDLNSRFGSPKVLADELAFDQGVDSKENEGKKSLDKKISFKLNDKPISIKVDLVVDDISIELSDDQDIHVMCNKVIKEDKYDISFKDNELCLCAKKQKSSFINFSMGSSLDFKILIPKTAVIDLITCNMVNGDLNLEDLTMRKTKLNIVSGDIEIDTFNSEYLIVSLVSGDLEISQAEIKRDFILHTVSGDSEISKVTCDILELHTVSGDIDGDELYPNKVKLKSVSGDINIENKKQSDIEIVSKSTVSGSINIKTNA